MAAEGDSLNTRTSRAYTDFCMTDEGKEEYALRERDERGKRKRGRRKGGMKW